MDYSTAYSPAGSSAGRSWAAAVARSPWDVPSREYREHRPGDDAAADDEGSVCRLRSRFRCRGAVCGASACEDGSRSSRGLGGTNEDWKPRREEEADTCSTPVDAPPFAAAAAAVAVAVAEQRTKMAAVAVAGSPLASSSRRHSRCSNRPSHRREFCPLVGHWNRRTVQLQLETIFMERITEQQPPPFSLLNTIPHS